MPRRSPHREPHHLSHGIHTRDEVSFVSDPTWDNATFATQLCSEITSATTQVTIIGVAGVFFQLPPCFAVNGVSIISLSATNLAIDGIALLPPTITSLTLVTSTIIDTSTGNDISYNWFNLFNHMPSLVEITLNGCGLDGELPSTLPSALLSIDLSNNLLFGSIPASLFINVTTASSGQLKFTATNNKLGGFIPSTLFDNSGLANINNIHISLASNLFAGLPSNLLGPIASTLQFFRLELNSNQLTGSIPDDFLFTPGTSTVINSLIVDISANPALSGAFPTGFFSSSLNPASTLSISLASTGMTGSITGIWSACNLANLNYLTLDFGGNSLTGPIPVNLLAPTSKALFSIDVDISSNSLSGPIPDSLFATIDMTTLYTFSFNAGSNGLSGSLPSPLMDSSRPAPVMTGIALYFNNNSLTGTFPSSYFSMLYVGATSSPAAMSTPTPASNDPPMNYLLDISGNQIDGTLELAALPTERQVSLIFRVGTNNLAGWSFFDEAAEYLTIFTIGSNPNFQGTMPSSIFSSTSVLSELVATNIGISGIMPNLESSSAPELYLFKLDYTDIDFCGGSNQPWAAALTCSLLGSTAYHCSSLWPSGCQITAAPPSVPWAPSTSVNAPSPRAPPTCVDSARPSPLFTCINGTWTTETQIVDPILVIPAGASQVIIIANVSSSSVVLQGLGTSLLIHGCANNLTEITVELNPDDLKKIGSKLNQTLITYDGTEVCNDLGTVGLNTKVTGATCRKVSSTKYSSQTQLSAVFSIDSSSCKVWWIILIAVLCAVVVIAVVAIVVIRLVCCKEKSFHEHAQNFQK